MNEPPENPYKAPSEQQSADDLSISNNPSIEFEPHLRSDEHYGDVDSSEVAAFHALSAPPASDEDRLHHTVWDEPGLSTDLSGNTPGNAYAYANWLVAKFGETSDSQSNRALVGIILSVGVASLAISIFQGLFRLWNAPFFMSCITFPIAEELAKIAVMIWVMERKPFLFKRPSQILWCSILGACLFIVVQNGLFFKLFSIGSEFDLMLWRWIALPLIHVICSLFSATGFVRVWRRCVEDRTRPEITLASSWVMIAMLVHCLFNAGWYFFEIA